MFENSIDDYERLHLVREYALNHETTKSLHVESLACFEWEWI